MGDKSFKEKVNSIDWTKYLGPEYHDPEKMDFFPDELPNILIRLSRYDESEDGNAFHSEMLFAFGNNHRGTYYPAALEAIDLIIEIQKYSESKAARNCATCMLNDLYYFQLEMNNKDEQLYEATENIIKEKLRPYSDENITNQWT